jgi:MFS family permease
VQTVGLVSASAGLGALVAQPLGGVLADAIGRRETMVLSLVATAASYPLLATVDGAVALFGAALLSAACADLYRPAGQALAADLVPESERTLWLTCFVVGLGLAALQVALAPSLRRRQDG